jgi:hypothetical protein
VVARRLVDGTDATLLLLGAGGSNEGPAHRRRLDHADDSLGQHQRAGGYDWRVRITIDGSRQTGNLDGMTDARMNQDNSMRIAYWLLGACQSVLADQASTAGRYDLAEGQFFPGTQTSPHCKIAGNASF